MSVVVSNEHPWERYQKVQALHGELDVILEQGSSAYRVSEDRSRLERRVDITVTAAADYAQAAASASPDTGSASDQLRTAWSELYGLNPDPPGAYSAAIKAVESAAHSVIEPNNSTSTLGKMPGQLRNAPHKYELAIPGPDGSGSILPLIAIIDLLWPMATTVVVITHEAWVAACAERCRTHYLHDRFVQADALTLRVREGGRTVLVHGLIATGVDADGEREILGFDHRLVGARMGVEPGASARCAPALLRWQRCGPR